ncbi:type 1 glutamine amidotransferase domain-containing protein [Staphylococcus pseudintermedius]|uniref:type 1 glutamine amidotransferase domain-containing protein n=1 Tax=Staphylococcus pseudintermedius TaxID=283734 RepID=UPI0019D83926|nr:type 1 glutamine amidotransferase domain-containing protein [Staphylococcus pseudintermedius]EGQ3565695.1 type 1 glutamine amidotransferase domain-containing protein [Staphylococcus pseudintermedius]EIE3603175.1 type 1 glutamine amidotransferase domain-containing protein [Staphylococcus pseudintermedius]ELJ9298136.1 type 1 glutamine amidotransferase domain-containing protein [Staphylococcus pseudintermedius]EMB9429585.1 type 1 glutamine amidotransferase domain-containing protein [Staphylococ
MKKALIVVTNISKYPDTERATGAWFSEVTHFAKDFYDAGYEVDLVSPKGGYVPLDPASLKSEMMTAEDWAYYTDLNYMNQFGHSLSPEEVNPDEYSAIYFAGGHGVVWDLRDNPQLNEIALSIYNNNGVLASVCHGAVGLIDIKENGENIVKGKAVTGFTNSEEQANGTTPYMPYLLEDELVHVGAQFKKEADWQSYAVIDGRIVTGQNPQSGHVVAENVLKLLTK